MDENTTRMYVLTWTIHKRNMYRKRRYMQNSVEIQLRCTLNVEN